MADFTLFIIAFILTAVVVVVARNRLPRWIGFTLTSFLAVIIFFTVATAILGRGGN